MKWFGLELTEICFFYSYQKWHSKKCLNDALCHNCNIFTCTQSISMKLILLESYEADLSNSGYNIQFGEELTEIQTNLYSVCKHSDTFLAHCICWETVTSTQTQEKFRMVQGWDHWAKLQIRTPRDNLLPLKCERTWLNNCPYS